jgi:hypothetical protein
MIRPILLLLIFTFSQAYSAENADQKPVIEESQKLIDFRNKLMEVAFSKGAAVKGLSYVDKNGILHENSLYKAKHSVKSTQIQTYLDEMRGDHVQAWGPVDINDACGLWSNASLSATKIIMLNMSSPNLGEAPDRKLVAPVESSLMTIIHQAMLNRGHKPHAWSVMHRDEKLKSVYQQALLSNKTQQGNADYMLDIKVALTPETYDMPFYRRWYDHVLSRTADTFNLNFSRSEKVPEFIVTVSLMEMATDVLLGKITMHLEGDISTDYHTGNIIVEIDRDDVLDEIMPTLDKGFEATKCMPAIFHVTRNPGNDYFIDSGMQRGLKKGDWLLVGERALLVDGQLDSTSLESLSLLKITDISLYSASAVLIDGDDKNLPRNLLATPL